MRLCISQHERRPDHIRRLEGLHKKAMARRTFIWEHSLAFHNYHCFYSWYRHERFFPTHSWSHHVILHLGCRLSFFCSCPCPCSCCCVHSHGPNLSRRSRLLQRGCLTRDEADDEIHSTFCFAQRPTCNLPKGGCSCLGPCFETARPTRHIGLMLNQHETQWAANEHDRITVRCFGNSSLLGSSINSPQ